MNSWTSASLPALLRSAPLIGAAQLDVDQAAAVLDPLAGHLAGDDVAVADVVELADLAALADQPAVVAHPVGQELRQPAVAHDPVVVGHRVADGLRPGRVPVHSLRDVGDAVLVLDVERRDALAVLVS